MDSIIDVPPAVAVGPVESPPTGLQVVSEAGDWHTRPGLAFHPGMPGRAALDQSHRVAAELVLETHLIAGETWRPLFAERIQFTCDAAAN